MNNLYISPEFEIIRVEILTDVLGSSAVENHSSYIDGPGDWGDPTVPEDPDEPIIW